ncbi:glucosylceramidase [Capnocytophaga sp. HP1101]
MKIFSSFLIISLLGAVTACSAPKQSHSPTVKVLTTTANRSLEFAKDSTPLLSVDKMPNTADISFKPTEKFQTIYGFGSAITGSTCYNLLQMNPADRKAFLTETFSETEGLGQNYVRISIGCSDFSLSEYTLCDTEGIANFALTDEENRYVIPVLKEILAINPKVQIIGSPWTPPRWMKVNNLKDLQPYNHWTSGQLNPAHYQDYALYFAKWLQAMKDNGINVNAITIQNEPLNRGNSASMYMGWEEQLAFIKTALGKTLKEKGWGQVKVYLFDHNYNYDNMASQKQYPLHIYKDAEASQYVTGAAYHNYGGDPDELNEIHQQSPDKELIFTESSIGTWNDGRNLERRLTEDMDELGIKTLNNHCKAVMVWNLLLDENGAPNREGGCKTCFGAVDIETSDYKTMRRNSHYYVIGHLSSVIKQGATRIGFEKATDNDVQCTAFENPDGSLACVLLNKKKEATYLTISTGTHYFSYEVPGNSVVSFLIPKI